MSAAVMRVAHCEAALVALLARYGLSLTKVANGAPIPGSFWGEDEAGLIGNLVYARADTPVHSVLHEACHWIVAPASVRATLHTNASDSIAEENATCYLQIVLADQVAGFGRARALADMDRWGYSFRLGSAANWFQRDADDARAFLHGIGALDALDQPIFDFVPRADGAAI